MVGRTNRREDSPRKSACITVLQQSDIDFWTLCKSFYACLPRKGRESIPYTKHRTWIPMFLFEVAPLKFARLPLSGDLPILAYFIVRLGRVPTPPCPDIYKGVFSFSLILSHSRITPSCCSHWTGFLPFQHHFIKALQKLSGSIQPPIRRSVRCESWFHHPPERPSQRIGIIHHSRPLLLIIPPRV